MKLVIGGAYQGKKDFVKENLKDEEIFDDFHIYILELIKKDIDAVTFIKDNIKDLENKVIICDDISCGVVPIDKTERKWREDLGRILVLISKNSKEVYRVFAGIGVKIK